MIHIESLQVLAASIRAATMHHITLLLIAICEELVLEEVEVVQLYLFHLWLILTLC